MSLVQLLCCISVTTGECRTRSAICAHLIITPRPTHAFKQPELPPRTKWRPWLRPEAD